MSAEAFVNLRAAISSETFSDNKLAVLGVAASHAFFSVQQLCEVVDLFTFSSDKLAAVRLVHHRLVDRENGFLLSQRFTFASDKQEVLTILAQQ